MIVRNNINAMACVVASSCVQKIHWPLLENSRFLLSFFKPNLLKFKNYSENFWRVRMNYPLSLFSLHGSFGQRNNNNWGTQSTAGSGIGARSHSPPSSPSTAFSAILPQPALLWPTPLLSGHQDGHGFGRPDVKVRKGQKQRQNNTRPDL